MASIYSHKDPFASPNANKALPPTPHSRSQSLTSLSTPMHLQSEIPFDPFLDPASPSARNNAPLPRLPREATFQSTTESLAGITASAGSVSEYETEYGYTESDLNGAARGFSRTVLNFTESDLYGASQGFSQSNLHFTEGDVDGASQGHTESDRHGVPQGVSQPGLNSSEVDLCDKSPGSTQAEHSAAGFSQASVYAPPARRPIRIITDDMKVPLSQQPKTSSDKSTLRGTYRTDTTLASVDNPFIDPSNLPFSSPATNITPARALPNSPYTPANLGTHPALRNLAGSYNPQGNGSTFSLNREVRLREAVKQQEILLRQQRTLDEKTRISLHTAPTLRPSPIALKVAAQLIRDSPAGRLPIGPQAVLHSKSFWIGLGIAQVGLISMTAAITKVVHDGSIYQNGPEVGTGNIFWLSISIVALIGGMIGAAVSFVQKMGFWVDSQQLLGLEDVGFMDCLLRRNRTPRREEEELGTSPGSVQTLASVRSNLTPREGLYASQGRFTYSTFNSLNPEWQELYMTPEQLRQRISLQNIGSPSSTPSKAGSSRDVNGLLSSGPSLEEFNQAGPHPLQPASVKYTQPPGTPNPFHHFPEPPTPHVPHSVSFQHLSSDESVNGTQNTTRESAKIEVDNWSPLENLTRDINSEHVRNMPMGLRHGYIAKQRMRSEDRARTIRESIERSSIRSTTRCNSDDTSSRPLSITEEEQRGRLDIATTPFKFKHPEPQKGRLINEEGVEMVDLELSSAVSTSMQKRFGEFEGEEGKEVELSRRRASGGSVEKMKKMLSMGKTGFRELDGRNVGTAVKEKIDRLREQSEKAQQSK